MRRFLFAVLCSVLVAVTSVGAAGDAVAAQDGVFRGTWTSTDHDGSSQELTIRGSGQGGYAMFLFDDSATGACGGAPAYFVGTGVADGDTLVMYGTLTCLPGGNVIRSRISIEFGYSPALDTLIDETGVTWHRA